ncbi:AraC family transcriptional regulator [Sediminibacter sp. Hel_I_10]|uniref:helix-turn-helix domain-containing protein n=1 Tax=Sediminibacter sp. Hel_I_10 TaxID=1392490 RepID=UPI0004796EC4|nr:AraC family transcriptional regulator [Sediminibacter sp. Hel_I_10]
MEVDVARRMKIINTMLLEMASGNFHFRIERSERNDNLEALIVTLNMLAEEIQEAMIHQGYANTNGVVVDLVQMSFLLDHNGLVEMCNQQTCTILSRLYDDTIGKPFHSFLSSDSASDWISAMRKKGKKQLQDFSLDLKFKSSHDLIIPKTAYISKFHQGKNGKGKVLITVIHHSNSQKELDDTLKLKVITAEDSDSEVTSPKTKIRLSFEDIRKIREGHDIMVNNLDKDFPPLREFAHQLGTNEFKLKYGFKELYGTSVHRFLMQERMRKSQMMIQYTDLPIKSIALMNGFKSMPHFSRAFKKRYGYSPSQLRKNALSDE